MSLKIEKLSKKFGDKRVFDDFSADFSDVGVYAVVGKSGIGKTTLLRMIAGLDTEYKGKIIGGGRENVSYAFQEYRLFPTLTALDNVLLANFDKPSETERTEAKNILTNLGFTKEELQLYPSQLSGGMKQRVSLARAFMKKNSVRLLNKQPILLLDEPTKELNSELAARIIELIRREGEKRLVIFVTHNEKDIENAEAKILQIPEL